MEQKQKTMALIFVMAFIATSIFIAFLNEGTVEGSAIKEFNSIKEKNNYCNDFCDEKMNKETASGSWIDCHEECVQ